jgi:hypothetical protein
MSEFYKSVPAPSSGHQGSMTRRQITTCRGPLFGAPIMSTVSTSGLHVPSGPEPDPFRYGWRYVKRVGPDGQETLDQIPLSLEDVLFPAMRTTSTAGWS